MPTQEHELFTELFRDDPSLAPELLERVVGVEIPPDMEARLGSPDLTECVPTEYRADAVVELTGPDDGMAIVVEVQRRQDPDKRWSWPVYVATLRKRLERPTVLLVLCTDDRTARWSRVPIEMGHPGWQLTPLAIGPSELLPITDPEQVSRHPELTLLAAAGHPGSEQALRSIPIALSTLHERKKENAKLYADYVYAKLPAAAFEYLEELMKTGTYEYQSEFARGYFAQGEAKAVLRVLDTRGIEVSEGARERIRACTDPEQVEVWLDRAVTAATVDDLFD